MSASIVTFNVMYLLKYLTHLKSTLIKQSMRRQAEKGSLSWEMQNTSVACFPLTCPLHTCNGLFDSKAGWSETSVVLRPALQGISVSSCSFLQHMWQQFLLLQMLICWLPSSPAKKGPKMKAAIFQQSLPLA